MDNLNISLEKSLVKGQYYVDARKWYINKYIAPIVERNILAVFLALVIFAISISEYFFLNLNNVNHDYNYLVSVDDITNNYALIKPIPTNSKNITPRDAVSSYMCKIFVEAFESYDYDLLSNRMNFVFNSSSNEISMAYQQYISLNNPSSPVVIYQRFAKRYVDVQKLQKDSNSDICYVTFKSTVVSEDNPNILDSVWKATIYFDMSSLESLIDEEKDKLDFKVTNYTTQQVK